MYKFKIANLKCMGCFRTIEAALKEIDQTMDVRVELKDKVVTIESQHPKGQLTKLIQDAGYEVLEVTT